MQVLQSPAFYQTDASRPGIGDNDEKHAFATANALAITSNRQLSR